MAKKKVKKVPPWMKGKKPAKGDMPMKKKGKC